MENSSSYLYGTDSEFIPVINGVATTYAETKPYLKSEFLLS